MALGRTIAELQATITPSEINVWLAYRRKFGPMNPVRQFDRPAALMATMMARTMGGSKTAKIHDFMPYGHHVKEEEDEFVDADTFLAALSVKDGVRDGFKRG